MTDLRSALLAVGATPALALQWAGPLSAAAALHDITSWKRLSAWLAQCSHESARFARVEEGLVYTSAQRIVAVFGQRMAALAPELVRAPAALANAVYADRLGNGPRSSGDGFRYRGRGLIQLTGRANYRKAGEALGLPLEDEPGRVLEPDVAALTAAWYWHEHGCNALADAGDIGGCTRIVNGPAMAGALERQELYKRALTALA